jgi:hypothetical protein
MNFRDWLFRTYIVLSHFKPKIFTSEEKEKQVIPKMIEDNRAKDRCSMCSLCIDRYLSLSKPIAMLTPKRWNNHFLIIPFQRTVFPKKRNILRFW